jgi:hypothetical protein
MKALIALGCLVLTMSAASAQPAPNADIREAVTAYIDRFIESCTNVIGEEHYTQEAGHPRGRRVLRSHFAVVRYPGSQLYVFRDAFEVDGKRVRSPEDDRLVQLFRDPTMTALQQAQDISNATTRHYIRDIGTVNNPLLVISLLQRANRHRFLLSPGNKERKLGPNVRVVGFREVVTPTILRWGGNIDMPAEGKLWVDEADGRIVRTELKLGERDIRNTSTVAWRPPTVITVTFASDETLGLDVAVEMHDTYPQERDEIRGVARYSNFRRLELGQRR